MTANHTTKDGHDDERNTMTKREQKKALKALALECMAEAKDNDFPIYESECLMKKRIGDVPGFEEANDETVMDILDNVSVGRDPLANM